MQRCRGSRKKVREGEESKQKLESIINLSCSNLEDVEILQEMPPEDKVLRLGKIKVDLMKKFTNIEEQRRPNTPPEVLERRIVAAAQAVKRKLRSIRNM